MLGLLRKLCLALALIGVLPQPMVAVAAEDPCGSDCPDDESGVPCPPFCPSCLCAPHAPRAAAPRTLTLEPPVTWRNGGIPESAARLVAEPDLPGIFHPPRHG
ncbi:MAG: hypothetical protein AB2A00_05245 [Myxococcota bacterium]